MTLILRALASAALVVGLLITVPTAPDAHGATAGRDGQQRTARKATVRKIGHAISIAVNQLGDPYRSGAAGTLRHR